MFEKGSRAWYIVSLIKAIFVPVDPYNNGWRFRLTLTGVHDNSGDRYGWSEIIKTFREW